MGYFDDKFYSHLVVTHLGNMDNSSNSEADASELLENIEEMFPFY